MSSLQRITTEYVEIEDRLRLVGELVNGATVVLWLTQRLVNRLLPHLISWLDQQLTLATSIAPVQAAHHDIVQSFVQHAARAQLALEPPVLAAASQAGWRVDAVDIAQGEDALVLTFKGEAQVSATLTLAAQPLRQWLGIVYEQCLRGVWSTTVWPAWMEQAQVSITPHTRSAMLH